jgi:hypothetical protein
LWRAVSAPSPACQRIPGRAPWYAPAPLRRLNTRTGLAQAHG